MVSRICTHFLIFLARIQNTILHAKLRVYVNYTSHQNRTRTNICPLGKFNSLLNNAKMCPLIPILLNSLFFFINMYIIIKIFNAWNMLKVICSFCAIIYNTYITFESGKFIWIILSNNLWIFWNNVKNNNSEK